VKVGLVALAVAVAVVVLSVGAALAATFSDPVGDTIVAPEGADVSTLSIPDITAIEVTNTPDGVVTFKVTLTAQTLSPISIVGLVLDLDKNPDTGDEGDEAELAWAVGPLGVSELVFARWDGAGLVEVTTTSATGSFSGGVVAITVPRSELLDTRGFTFGVVAITLKPDLSTLVFDLAPDSEDPFLYDLEGLLPPPPPTLSADGLGGIPTRPRAGKQFIVSTLVTRSDTGDLVGTGSVACAARVGAARIKETGRFRQQNAQCVMTVPRKAKGKVLRGTMTIRAAGATLKKSFSFRVT